MTFRPATDSLENLEHAFAALEADALSSLDNVSKTFGPARLTRQADGRYVGQGFNLSVPLPAGPYAGDGASTAAETRAALVHAFETVYREKFGRTPPDVPVELVNLRVTGDAAPREEFTPHPLAAGTIAMPKATREVYFKEAGGFVSTPVFERWALKPGFVAEGPLLVEDASSTLVVGPQGHVEQLSSGNLVITIKDHA